MGKKPRIRDLLLTLTGLPAIAAALYSIIMAYKTFHPDRVAMSRHPENYKLPFEPVTIAVQNSTLTLDGWFIPAPGAQHAIIVGHEWGSHKGTKLRYAEFLHKAGYNVVLFDHRNHGNSSRDKGIFEMSKRYTDDMAAVVSFVRNKFGFADTKIGILAFSFSAFPALYLMLRPRSSVNAIILDSGPALSIADTCKRFMDSFGILKVPGMFRGPILFRIVKASYVWATLTMLWVVWPPRLFQSPTKLFFIANENDAIIPPEEMQQIARLKLDAELWLAPQTSHLMAFRTHAEEYCKRVTSFLEKSLSSPE